MLCLRNEFLFMLQKLPEPSVTIELWDAVDIAKSHVEVLSVVRNLWQVCVSVSLDISSYLYGIQ